MCLAIPTRIETINPDGTAIVELDGVRRAISLVFTPEAQVGDYVLVHTGYAISVLSEEEALASLEAFAQIATLTEQEEA